MTQQYSLRWNNHQPNFISMFTTLLNTQTLVDVTLAAEGKHLQAHKVVLSACSTYFQALFVDNPSRHPIVILKDVTFADLRTMVDFMYYGEVNVTEEQLPQVLDTAKLLKIKGLTEMPDSTSLTRSQGNANDFQSPGDGVESHRHSTSPAASPRNRQKRRRKSSTGSTSLNMVAEENRNDEVGHPVDVVRGESITLSSVPQQRRIREYDDRVEHAQQAGEPHNLNVEPLAMDNNPMVIPQGGQWSMMEHTYPRYSNTCIGGSGGLQADAGMYNVINPHMDNDLNDYGQGLDVAGPSPGTSCVTDQQTVQEAVPNATPKRRRATNPQSEENFQRALEAVRFGGIGFCKAARLFGVNNRTLWLEYKKKGYPNNRPSIKSRIKREHTTPPPELKDDNANADQQLALLCPPHPVPECQGANNGLPPVAPCCSGLTTNSASSVQSPPLMSHSDESSSSRASSPGIPSNRVRTLMEKLVVKLDKWLDEAWSVGYRPFTAFTFRLPPIEADPPTEAPAVITQQVPDQIIVTPLYAASSDDSLSSRDSLAKTPSLEDLLIEDPSLEPLLVEAQIIDHQSDRIILVGESSIKTSSDYDPLVSDQSDGALLAGDLSIDTPSVKAPFHPAMESPSKALSVKAPLGGTSSSEPLSVEALLVDDRSDRALLEERSVEPLLVKDLLTEAPSFEPQSLSVEAPLVGLSIGAPIVEPVVVEDLLTEAPSFVPQSVEAQFVDHQSDRTLLVGAPSVKTSSDDAPLVSDQSDGALLLGDLSLETPSFKDPFHPSIESLSKALSVKAPLGGTSSSELLSVEAPLVEDRSDGALSEEPSVETSSGEAPLVGDQSDGVLWVESPAFVPLSDKAPLADDLSDEVLANRAPTVKDLLTEAPSFEPQSVEAQFVDHQSNRTLLVGAPSIKTSSDDNPSVSDQLDGAFLVGDLSFETPSFTAPFHPSMETPSKALSVKAPLGGTSLSELLSVEAPLADDRSDGALSEESSVETTSGEAPLADDLSDEVLADSFDGAPTVKDLLTEAPSFEPQSVEAQFVDNQSDRTILLKQSSVETFSDDAPLVSDQSDGALLVGDLSMESPSKAPLGGTLSSEPSSVEASLVGDRIDGTLSVQPPSVDPQSFEAPLVGDHSDGVLSIGAPTVEPLLVEDLLTEAPLFEAQLVDDRSDGALSEEPSVETPSVEASIEAHSVGAPSNETISFKPAVVNQSGGAFSDGVKIPLDSKKIPALLMKTPLDEDQSDRATSFEPPSLEIPPVYASLDGAPSFEPLSVDAPLGGQQSNAALLVEDPLVKPQSLEGPSHKTLSHEAPFTVHRLVEAPLGVDRSDGTTSVGALSVEYPSIEVHSVEAPSDGTISFSQSVDNQSYIALPTTSQQSSSFAPLSINAVLVGHQSIPALSILHNNPSVEPESLESSSVEPLSPEDSSDGPLSIEFPSGRTSSIGVPSDIAPSYESNHESDHPYIPSLEARQLSNIPVAVREPMLENPPVATSSTSSVTLPSEAPPPYSPTSHAPPRFSPPPYPPPPYPHSPYPSFRCPSCEPDSEPPVYPCPMYVPTQVHPANGRPLYAFPQYAPNSYMSYRPLSYASPPRYMHSPYASPYYGPAPYGPTQYGAQPAYMSRTYASPSFPNMYGSPYASLQMPARQSFVPPTFPPPSYPVPSYVPMSYSVPRFASSYSVPRFASSYSVPRFASSYSVPRFASSYSVPPSASSYSVPPSASPYSVPPSASSYSVPPFASPYSVPPSASSYSVPPFASPYSVPLFSSSYMYPEQPESPSFADVADSPSPDNADEGIQPTAPPVYEFEEEEPELPEDDSFTQN